MLVLCMVLCCSLDPVIRYAIPFNKILNSHKNIKLTSLIFSIPSIPLIRRPVSMSVSLMHDIMLFP